MFSLKIIKFKKDKGNKYKIYLDNELIIDLYDDVIIKYNLISNKEINNKLLEEITTYNTFLDGYYKAIKIINKRLRTKKKIENYLTKQNIKKEEINKIINLLEKDNYLNQDLYIKSYISDQYNLTLNGPIKIKKDLNNLGINKDIDNYLNKYDWNIRIDKIINKKIKLNNKLSNNALKNKIINDIINLGYEKEIIEKKLETIEFNDNDILIKELNKIKNKYEKKYKDNELKYKVINYLYRKGFNIEDIKRYYENEI